jgi:hypothetical protein
MWATPPGTPAPSGDHATPFQRAMLFAGTPPAAVNVPPTTTSPFGSSASLVTHGVAVACATPPPNELHALPFQRARRFAGTAPDAVKSPPASTSPLGNRSRSWTAAFRPAPIGVHAVPVHSATFAVAIVPQLRNVPPIAMRSPTNGATADTRLGAPSRSACHDVPFQRATLSMPRPSIDANMPYASTPLPGSSIRWTAYDSNTPARTLHVPVGGEKSTTTGDPVELIDGTIDTITSPLAVTASLPRVAEARPLASGGTCAVHAVPFHDHNPSAEANNTPLGARTSEDASAGPLPANGTAAAPFHVWYAAPPSVPRLEITRSPLASSPSAPPMPGIPNDTHAVPLQRAAAPRFAGPAIGSR